MSVYGCEWFCVAFPTQTTLPSSPRTTTQIALTRHTIHDIIPSRYLRGPGLVLATAIVVAFWRLSVLCKWRSVAYPRVREMGWSSTSYIACETPDFVLFLPLPADPLQLSSFPFPPPFRDSDSFAPAAIKALGIMYGLSTHTTCLGLTTDVEQFLAFLSRPLLTTSST